MSHGVLSQAFVYLLAAVIMVPFAKRYGLGSVLGYLLAGVAVGPFALGLVGGSSDVMHFAEFGVVMMLFLVGLELKPSLLWELRRPILGLGGAQVVTTIGVVALVAIVLGQPWKVSVALGTVIAMSSTAIVLSSLAEKGLLKTSGGQAAFSVLLFQDIAVIPILAVFPLLGAGIGGVGEEAKLPGYLQALMVFGAVAVLVLAGRYVVRPMFRLLAETRLREVFTAAALLLVVGIALLMELVGLSPALGTFMAGVVLAESEYRHELESDIEPFKGLLLGLFFISVGAQIDFAYVGSHVVLVLGLVLFVMGVKLALLFGLGRVFGLDRSAQWLLALGLAQVGEFAFVLISFARQEGVFGESVATPMTAVIALSMGLTPLLFVVLERVVLPRLTGSELREQDGEDSIHGGDGHVVIAGFGRFGQVVGRFLKANGFTTTVLDLDPGMVDVLRKLDHEVHYGDASRPELLVAAGCDRAKLFVLAVDDPESSRTIAETVRQLFPNLPILARVRNRQHYYDLYALGIRRIYRETFASALEVGVDAVVSLGMRANTAHRLARKFRDHDERALEELGKLWDDEDESNYFAAARQSREEMERLMRQEKPSIYTDDSAWDNESLRKDVVENANRR